MGFRFSRRIKIMPGVRLNVSKSGVSLSAGPRGASVTLGKRGVYGNVSIPGTGLSYRERLDRPAGDPPRPAQEHAVRTDHARFAPAPVAPSILLEAPDIGAHGPSTQAGAADTEPFHRGIFRRKHRRGRRSFLLALFLLAAIALVAAIGFGTVAPYVDSAVFAAIFLPPAALFLTAGWMLLVQRARDIGLAPWLLISVIGAAGFLFPPTLAVILLFLMVAPSRRQLAP